MKPSLPRGFKTRAEKLSIHYRKDLGLGPSQACPSHRLAQLLGFKLASNGYLIRLLNAGFCDDYISSPNPTEQLSGLYQAKFSAMLAIVNEEKMILFDEQESLERQESSIMHELAHALCEHPGDALQLRSDMALRIHNSSYEYEAEWMGGALQIPDVGMFWHAKRGRTVEDIARIYNASIEMAQFRWNVCGITRRLGR